MCNNRVVSPHIHAGLSDNAGNLDRSSGDMKASEGLCMAESTSDRLRMRPFNLEGQWCKHNAQLCAMKAVLIIHQTCMPRPPVP